MKKTLAALIIGAFAASAANAAVIYNNEGTKVEVDGSLRFILEKTNKGGHFETKNPTTGITTAEGKTHTHSGLRNTGSRFGIRAKHELDNGYYALGRLEVRLDGKSANTDGFGDLYTKRAYIGLGHKEFGELTFGRQVTIADDLSIAEDKEYGIIDKDDYIPTAGNSVIRYDYKGIENLQLGASYQFANTRDNNNEVKSDSYYTNGELNKASIANAFQVGAIYNGKLDEQQDFILKFGYGRTTYKSPSQYKHNKDGFLASLGYNYSAFLVSVDGGYSKEKIDNARINKFFVSPGFQYEVTKESTIYGNYKYEQTKQDQDKQKTNGFLLGTSYKIHKQVLVYLEGKYQVTKDYKNGTYVKDSKVKDKAIGVGMRVYF